MRGNKKSEETGKQDRCLREAAEEQLAQHLDVPGDMKGKTPTELIQELWVHQIELGMQNEELRRAQEALEASQARYFDLYDLAPVGHFILSQRGLILEANLTAANLLGVDRVALARRRLSIFILPEDQDIYYLYLKQLFETDVVQVCEIRMARKDTAVFWARLEGVATQYGDGCRVCRAAMSDISERKQSEENLRKTMETYRLVVDNMADVITVMDLNLRFTYVSPSVIRLRGYTAEEVMAQTLDQVMTPESLQIVARVFEEELQLETSGTAAPDRTRILELEEYNKDGSTVWLENHASCLRDKDKKLSGFIALSRDITDRKRAEKQLRDSLQSLKRAVGVTIQVMVSAVEARDPYTAGHQIRSADLAQAIATEMGLPQEKIDGIRIAGTIHDIGKLSIPAEILSKPTKLSEIEFSLIQEHAQHGFKILKDVESPWPLAELIYQHHERMDGSGYPRHLRGDDILPEARILAVADVVEAIASHRPYRPAFGIDVALEEISKKRGILYDPEVVDTCLKLFQEQRYRLN